MVLNFDCVILRDGLLWSPIKYFVVFEGKFQFYCKYVMIRLHSRVYQNFTFLVSLSDLDEMLHDQFRWDDTYPSIRVPRVFHVFVLLGGFFSCGFQIQEEFFQLQIVILLMYCFFFILCPEVQYVLIIFLFNTARTFTVYLGNMPRNISLDLCASLLTASQTFQSHRQRVLQTNRMVTQSLFLRYITHHS